MTTTTTWPTEPFQLFSLMRSRTFGLWYVAGWCFPFLWLRLFIASCVMYSCLSLIFFFILLFFLHRGVGTIDIALTNVDINQCDKTRGGTFQFEIFAGTHNCKNETTQVTRIALLLFHFIDISEFSLFQNLLVWFACEFKSDITARPEIFRNLNPDRCNTGVVL